MPDPEEKNPISVVENPLSDNTLSASGVPPDMNPAPNLLPEGKAESDSESPTALPEKTADGSGALFPQMKRHPKRFIFYRRMTGGLVLLFALAILFFGKPIPGTWKILGIPMQVAGSLLMLSGLFVRFQSTCWISGYKNRMLLRDGPYRYVRHPLYFGSTLATLGIGLISLSPWLIGLCIVTLAPLFYATAVYEERKLAEWFGEEYTKYLNSTPRFFPRGWTFAFPEQYTPSAFGIAREAFTAVGFIGVAAICVIINYLITNSRILNDAPHIFHVFSG